MKNPTFRTTQPESTQTSGPQPDGEFSKIPPPHPRRAELLPKADHLVGVPYAEPEGMWIPNTLLPRLDAFCDEKLSSPDFEDQMAADLGLPLEDASEEANRTRIKYLIGEWFKDICAAGHYPGRRKFEIKILEDAGSVYHVLVIHEDMDRGWKSYIADFFDTRSALEDYLLAGGFFMHPEIPLTQESDGKKAVFLFKNLAVRYLVPPDSNPNLDTELVGDPVLGDASPPVVRKFLGELKRLGGKASCGKLRKSLGWSIPSFYNLRDLLIIFGQIQKVRGSVQINPNAPKMGYRVD